jgi:hypothetical protein
LNKKTNWIINYIEQNGDVDVLNESFVDAYVESFGVTIVVRFWCANKCEDLGRQLSRMYKEGLLFRSIITIGVYDLPKWVYVYSLSKI